jgi:hypothetical protein
MRHIAAMAQTVCSLRNETAAAKDYQASIEKLRKDAAEAALISHLATNMTKGETFDRQHQHLSRLANEDYEIWC